MTMFAPFLVTSRPSPLPWIRCGMRTSVERPDLPKQGRTERALYEYDVAYVYPAKYRRPCRASRKVAAWVEIINPTRDRPTYSMPAS